MESANVMSSTASEYLLDVGDAGAARLRLLNEIYGPESMQLLLRAGLREGMRVLDVGCGIGTMTRWIGTQVGPEGAVVGLDGSAEHIARAREAAHAEGSANVTFVEGSAYDLSVAGGGFDLVYCRLLLMHLERPSEALSAMRAQLAPGGVLVCEDSVVDSSFCDPPSAAQRRLTSLAIATAAQRGHDFSVAGRLDELLRAAGFENVQVARHQPSFVRGEAKRFEELCFREVAPHVIESGLATSDDIAEILNELGRIAEDESVRYHLAEMTQVWGTRPEG